MAAQKITPFLALGMNYRGYPVDIENVPRGGYRSNGLPDDEKFWNSVSLDSKAGIKFRNNWQVSLNICTRYNHLHWLQGRNYTLPSAGKRQEKKNVKFDFFVQAGKRFQLKPKTEKFFFVAAGIGIVNVNTKYKVFLRDTLPSGPTQGETYEGSFLNFSPGLSLGYQCKRMTFSADTHIIEGPDRTDLTSLWMGITISYEILPGKKRRGKSSLK